ncbi:NAD(P)-binding protein [Peniophora sp. CONT]|nr:NAD(P)-binding protein [Peniophora sp. CONT]
MSSRPIIVVTGANNGIGFGVCRRLLFSLAHSSPPDAKPLFPRTGEVDAGIDFPCEGVTLVMACRSQQRAEDARAELLRLFEEDVRGINDTNATLFRKNVEIVIHKLDLASVSSTLDFCDDLKRSYPYISHLILNAGVAPFERIHWPSLGKQIFTDLFGALTYPRYNIQHHGQLSDDGLGWVWQCNVFGHYVLARALEPMLAASARESTGPGRVIWMSSLEAFPQFFDVDDWQLVKTQEPYQGSKYENDLIGAELNRRALLAHTPVRHIIVHPGVVHTSIDLLLISAFLHHLKHIAFWLARCLGSPHHNISSWNGAMSAVHATIASLAFLPAFVRVSSTPTSTFIRSPDTVPDADAMESLSHPQDIAPVKLHSTTRFWKNSVEADAVREWKEHSDASVKLTDHCETLYQTFLAAEGRDSNANTSNGHGNGHGNGHA